MNTYEILEAIDKQITQLQQARALLSDATLATRAMTATTRPSIKRRGRPKGSISKKPDSIAPAPAKKVRPSISAEGKARIAAAQKARWAALKKSSKVAKPAAKKTSVKQSKKAVTSAKETAAAKRAPAEKSVAPATEA